MRWTMLAAICTVAALPAAAELRGHYLEVRTCDVYTGPCFANGEMGLTGREAILVWSVAEGNWNGVDLAGLSVIAAVENRDTLGDVQGKRQDAKAAIIVDERATAEQREALEAMVRAKASDLIGRVTHTEAAPIEARLAACGKNGCAQVKAGDLVTIDTRCMGGDDHVCGNESTFYPPLLEVTGAYPVYTRVAAYQGSGLNLKWAATEQRGAFLAAFEY